MIKRYLSVSTLFVLLVFLFSAAIPSRAATEARLLSDPFLQLPSADSVRVVWFTEFEGQSHTLAYGENLAQTVSATTTKMSRMYEDANSRIKGRESPEQVTERDVWRHEAVASGLTPNVRVPYRVTSVTADGTTVNSEQFTLQALPTAGQGMKILLTSDQQNRLMSPANFQKVVETVGQVDAVFFAGDLVDNPHRASEWFDRYDPAWLDNPGNSTQPAFPGTRPAFFPSMQGNYQELFPEFPYTGGAILQHAPLFGTIGNHESPGRWRPNAQFQLNGITQTATIDFMDNDPQPRWFAEIQYERLKEADPSFNPTDDPAFRAQWIRDNSYEFTQYFEMWSHPDSGPQGESYWAYQIGDVFVISMNVSRVWRTWNIEEGSAEARFSPRGKFTEFSSELDDPSAWGFGDMWFETYGIESEQYEWLQGVLESEAFKNAKYRVVLGHQTMFGVGDNAVPVMADPVATIAYETAGYPFREGRLPHV
jgi:hypothetical protein